MLRLIYLLGCNTTLFLNVCSKIFVLEVWQLRSVTKGETGYLCHVP